MFSIHLRKLRYLKIPYLLKNKTENKLKEGLDYYFDANGLMVFTREYHLKRGYCCKNNCRNCPY